MRRPAPRPPEPVIQQRALRPVGLYGYPLRGVTIRYPSRKEGGMPGGWWLLWGVLAAFGVPLAVVGIILRLCERSWQKPAGSMGSRWLLVAGVLLCLPLLLYLAPVVLERLSG